MLLSWAVDGKHDSSLSAWPLPPRSLESGVVRGIGEIGGLSPRVPFLDRRRSGPLGHRGGYMGPCNEKTLTGPACSVMKVLQSCEWKHTSFMLLSRCLSHRLPLIHSKSKRGGAGDAPKTTARRVKHSLARNAAWIFNETTSGGDLHPWFGAGEGAARGAASSLSVRAAQVSLLLTEMDYDVCTPL